MTIQQLIAELKERDPEAQIVVSGEGDITDIIIEYDGIVTLLGEDEEWRN